MAERLTVARLGSSVEMMVRLLRLGICRFVGSG